MAIWSGICVMTVLALLATGVHSQQNVCGKPPLNSRIVGGQNAPLGAWPWQCSLHVKERGHTCGGSLINNKWVVSAAHCFNSVQAPASWEVYVGRQAQLDSNPNEQRRDVMSIIRHPNYDDNSSDNDVALLELSSTVEFTDFILPVCLARDGSTFRTGTNSWVTGFGLLTEDGSAANILQEVEVPVVGPRRCNCQYGVGTITENMICAGLPEGGKDSCQGDSGGPMVIKLGARWVLSGVVSFGNGCARPNFPGVYAKVSRYEEWIKSIITTNTPGFFRITAGANDPDNDVTCTGLPPFIPQPPPTTTPKPVMCGNAPMNSRIGAGSGLVASAGVWPWQASLQKGGAHVCGGTLVAEEYVMSDAKCFNSSNPNPAEWTVFLGRLKQNGSNPFQMVLNVSTITLSNRTGTNVAVLKLASKPALTDYVQPVCVDLDGTRFGVGTQCWVTGWGAGQGGEEQILQELQTNVVSCGNSSSSENICTPRLPLQQGDQGGPLMCKQGNSWFQVAVITLDSSGNSTLNDSSSGNSTVNNSSSGNSTVNNSSSGNSTVKTRSGMVKMDPDVQVFTKTSQYGQFLRQTVGSFPPPVTATTAAPSTTSKAADLFPLFHVLLLTLSLGLLSAFSN